MSEILPEQDPIVFNPDRTQDLFNYLNAKLKRVNVSYMFEREGTLSEDEVRGLISLYALTPKEEHKEERGETTGEAKEMEETCEQFIARTLLVPILTYTGKDAKDHRKEYKRLHGEAKQAYTELFQAQHKTELGKFPSADYLSFISSITVRLSQRIKRKEFMAEDVAKNAASRSKRSHAGRPTKPKASQESVETSLPKAQSRPKPETAAMIEKIKLLRDMSKSAGLDTEEAAGLSRMLSGKRLPAKPDPAIEQALSKVRTICYAAAATKRLKMTPTELQRVNALLYIEGPHSLYKQVYHARHYGDGRTESIEAELLSGLRKIVDAYTSNIGGVTKRPAK